MKTVRLSITSRDAAILVEALRERVGSLANGCSPEVARDYPAQYAVGVELRDETERMEKRIRKAFRPKPRCLKCGRGNCRGKCRQ